MISQTGLASFGFGIAGKVEAVSRRGNGEDIFIEAACAPFNNWRDEMSMGQDGVVGGFIDRCHCIIFVSEMLQR